MPFVTYSAKQLTDMQGDFTSSNFVKKITGVDNVCERAVKCFGAGQKTDGAVFGVAGGSSANLRERREGGRCIKE